MKIHKTKDNKIVIDMEGDTIVINEERDYVINIKGSRLVDDIKLRNFKFIDKEGKTKLIISE